MCDYIKTKPIYNLYIIICKILYNRIKKIKIQLKNLKYSSERKERDDVNLDFFRAKREHDCVSNWHFHMWNIRA